MPGIPRALVVFACLATALPSFGQEMSDAEMLQRFRAQRAALDAAQSGQGATRGLSLVTNQGQAAAPATPQVETIVVAPPATPEPGAVDPNAPLVISRFDPSMEVGIKIRFEFDSATISPSQEPALAQMCRVIRQSGIEGFTVIGHTDSSGSDDYNQRLSQLRADEVGRHLVRECGISAEHIRTVGQGERFPANTTDPAAAENRRVELQVTS